MIVLKSAFKIASLLAFPAFAATQQPWLTGPLIAPLGTAVKYGELVLRSYVYATVVTGAYGDDGSFQEHRKTLYRFNPRFFCFFGLTPWCDINIIPQFFYNTASGRHYVDFGDLTVGLDFQLMDADVTPYFPGIKLAIREVFPTGNFQSLRPRLCGVDLTGEGTFATQFDLVFYKVFQLRQFHWLSMTLSAEYTVNTPVNVHNFNAYGGGFGTNGTIVGGNRFQGIASFEWTLNQTWVFALDNVYTFTESSQFYGMRGISFRGTYASNGKPVGQNLSFAPALEYHFGPHFAIIAGCWFSAIGKNSEKFRSAVVNFQYKL